MSTTDGADLDASTFDLDAWIDGVQRPEITVELYRNETAFQIRLADLERQIEVAERNPDADRGIDEASAEVLRIQLDEMLAERSRNALRVRIRQLTDEEIVAAAAAAKDAGESQVDANLYALAAACVEPTFTPDQLKRLRDKSRDGQSMVNQLYGAANQLLTGLPVPSSPAR